MSNALNKAKQTISDHLGKSGHNNTTVHENVAPAVTHETVKPAQHENVTTAVDKEIHQDHYHTSVQPVHDTKVTPEKHTHNAVPVEHRSFEHGSTQDRDTRIAAEAAKFKDQRVTSDTTHTHSVAPTVAGEHTHHHVHETIQPVVQRETIQPNVVHTTVPVHEVHHNAAQHHTSSALPAVSMDEFQKQGGVLGGRGERTDAFTGEPRSVGGALNSSATGTHGTHGTTGAHHTSTGTAGHTAGSTTTGTHGSSTTNKLGHEAERAAGHHGTTGTSGTSGTGASSTGQNSSLLDKINPRKDADHDGKRGVMD